MTTPNPTPKPNPYRKRWTVQNHMSEVVQIFKNCISWLVCSNSYDLTRTILYVCGEIALKLQQNKTKTRATQVKQNKNTNTKQRTKLQQI